MISRVDCCIAILNGALNSPIILPNCSAYKTHWPDSRCSSRTITRQSTAAFIALASNDCQLAVLMFKRRKFCISEYLNCLLTERSTYTIVALQSSSRRVLHTNCTWTILGISRQSRFHNRSFHSLEQTAFQGNFRCQFSFFS